MPRAIKVDRIEINSDGSCGLRLQKQFLDDDGAVLSEEPHRHVFTSDMTEAQINAHLDAISDNFTKGVQMAQAQYQRRVVMFPALSAEQREYIVRMVMSARAASPVN